MDDSIASLVLGAGGLFVAAVWIVGLFLFIGWPIMALVALRHLKSIRQSLEQLARSAEMSDARAAGPGDWSKPTVVGER